MSFKQGYLCYHLAFEVGVISIARIIGGSVELMGMTRNYAVCESYASV